MDSYRITELVAVTLSLFFFALSSAYDLKTREVDDKVWIAFGSLGAAVTGVRLILAPAMLYLTLISIAITVLISFALFYLGLFGGADAKAMMCLGLTLPLAPNIIPTLLGYVHPVFPITVVIVSFICSASIAIWFGLTNAIRYMREGSGMFEGLDHESRGKKIIAAVTGYRTDIHDLNSKYYLYPIEVATFEEGGCHRSLKLFWSVDVDRDRSVSDITETLARANFKGKIWVTPGLPMLVFILIGLLITLILGDPIFSTVLSLAKH